MNIYRTALLHIEISYILHNNLKLPNKHNNKPLAQLCFLVPNALHTSLLLGGEVALLGRIHIGAILLLLLLLGQLLVDLV